MLITRRSIYSGQTRTIDLPITYDEWERYAAGTKVQIAFPHLTPDQREFLISGCTAEEWDEMFSPENEG